MEILATAVTLFLIMDPLGNIPLFLAVLKNVAPERRSKVLLREVLIAYAIMTLFLFFGPPMLAVLGLYREAVSMGGAIVLFIIAIRMIFPLRDGHILGGGDDNSEEPLIVPLAIPMFAGPSLLATLILLVKNDPGHILRSFFAMSGAWLSASLILLASPIVLRVLGNRVLKAIERLMGMILISISMQMLLDAITEVGARLG